MLSPLFLLAIVLIKLEPRSPVFSVRRKNCYGLNVSVWRFSTETCGENIAHFLVYTRLDRVPSLLNVLRGDVSIVGPSFQEGVVVPPLFLEALQNCPFKPGLLALKIPPDKANLRWGPIKSDYYYVSHWSLLLDLKIMVVHLFSKQACFLAAPMGEPSARGTQSVALKVRCGNPVTHCPRDFGHEHAITQSNACLAVTVARPTTRTCRETLAEISACSRRRYCRRHQRGRV